MMTELLTFAADHPVWTTLWLLITGATLSQSPFALIIRHGDKNLTEAAPAPERASEGPTTRAS